MGTLILALIFGYMAIISGVLVYSMARYALHTREAVDWASPLLTLPLCLVSLVCSLYHVGALLGMWTQVWRVW